MVPYSLFKLMYSGYTFECSTYAFYFNFLILYLCVSIFIFKKNKKLGATATVKPLRCNLEVSDFES